jgi:hypothetical protein
MCHSRTLAQACVPTRGDTPRIRKMVGDRVLEVIAGVAAVIFVAAMIWSDFSFDPEQRREPQQRWARVRPIQYDASLIVLVCVIALAVRG